MQIDCMSSIQKNKLLHHKMQFTLPNIVHILHQFKLQLVKLQNNNEPIKQSNDYFIGSSYLTK